MEGVEGTMGRMRGKRCNKGRRGAGADITQLQCCIAQYQACQHKKGVTEMGEHCVRKEAMVVLGRVRLGELELLHFAVYLRVLDVNR